jgi:hypothetical protein
MHWMLLYNDILWVLRVKRSTASTKTVGFKARVFQRAHTLIKTAAKLSPQFMQEAANKRPLKSPADTEQVNL